MATITFYRTEIVPDKNALIDDLESYLITCNKREYYDIQYFKHGLNTSITIDVNGNFEAQDIQDHLMAFPANYLKVQNSSSAKPFYYFIVSTKWRSERTVEFNLLLDTLNTFRSNYISQFDARTTIIREHRDRFHKTHTGVTYQRLIDFEDEGIQPVKFVTERGKVIDNDFPGNWHLIYKNTTYKEGEVDARLPITCQLLYDEQLFVKKNTADYGQKVVKLYDGFEHNRGVVRAYYIYNNYHYTDGVQKTFSFKEIEYKVPIDNNVVYELICHHDAGARYIEKLYRIDYDSNMKPTVTLVDTYQVDLPVGTPEDLFLNCEDVSYYDVHTVDPKVSDFPTDYDLIRYQLPRLRINAGKEPDDYTFGIDEVNKSDPKIVKIICLPYAPTKFSKSASGEVEFSSRKWFFNEGYFEAYSVATEFENSMLVDSNNILNLNELSVNLPSVNDLDTTLRNKAYESKLYNSSFYLKQLVYDDKTLDFPYEQLKGAKLSNLNFNVGFKPTNTINSNFIFFTSAIQNGFNTNQVYPGIITVKRNNEELILNSSYLNYINNGYNYDKKHRQMDLNEGILRGVLGLGGQALAFTGVGNQSNPGLAATSLAANFSSNLISGVVSTINQQIKIEDNMKVKLKDLSNQMVSVAGSDDIDLLKFYSDNKLMVVESRARLKMQENIALFFHLTGYSHPYQEEPVINSRRWFNFIQCKPIFKIGALSTIKEEFMTDIKERFNLGVTVYHNVNGKWDFDQELENFETWLYN